MDADADRIASLVQRVHGHTETCWSCGVRGPVDPATIESRLLLNGHEATYGRCQSCAALPVGKELHRLVVAALLDLDPADRAAAGVEVAFFADEPGADPNRPNTTAWGHVSRKRLAREVARRRDEIAARQGGPCVLCGVGETPAGTSWGHRQNGAVCGPCMSDFSDEGLLLDVETIRDYAATTLAGVGSGGGRSRRIGLGRQLGLKFFYEAGRREPNERRWGHVDRSRWAAILNAKPTVSSIYALDAIHAERRDPIERRRGGPCICCGTGVRPHGSRWVEGPGERDDRGRWLTGTKAIWCSPCWERTFGINRGRPIDVWGKTKARA